jgi:AAA domain/Bifunctional DNA primase/polymerase, N-terminal/Primase C terminal 1 (PriCT-1)
VPDVAEEAARAAQFIEHARRCSELGMALVRLDGKVPRSRDWQKEKPDPPEYAAGQWAEWGRRFNMGVLLGGSVPPLAVVEDDAPDAREQLLELFGGALPPTPIVQSGGKSLHVYFLDGGQGNASLDGLELRAGAQQCVVPPSIHPETGRSYMYVEGHEPWVVPFMEIPDEALAYFAGALFAAKRAEPIGEKLREGDRHRKLLSLAGSMRHRGMTGDEIALALLGVNAQRGDPPLPDEEVIELARDIARRYEPAPPDVEQERIEREAARLLSGGAAKEPSVSSRRGPLGWDWLTAFATKRVVWLDRPFWQAAAFHLKVGRKGVGKGTALADLAARFSRGEMGPKRRVLWIGSEDSVSIDVKPRVLAADGDPSQIAVVKDWLQLPRDVPRLEATIEAVGDVGLLVIDPVSNHIAGKNSNDETDVREAIAHLNALADGFALVAVGVRHLTEKEAKGGLLAAILGSSAWVQVPRAVIALARDPHDDAVVHMQVVAGNRMPPGTSGRSFRIEGAAVETDDGLGEVSRVVWEGESTVDVEELLTVRHTPEPSRSEDARALILATLQAAPGQRMGAEEFDALIAEQAGVSAKTVRNLRSELGAKGRGWLKAIPVKDEFGEVLSWDVGLTAGAPEPDPDSPDPDLYTSESGSGDLQGKQPFSASRSRVPGNTGSGSGSGQAQCVVCDALYDPDDLGATGLRCPDCATRSQAEA